MPNIESYMKRLPPPQRNILRMLASAGNEVQIDYFEKAGFEKNLISSSLFKFENDGVVEARAGEKGKTFYKIKS